MIGEEELDDIDLLTDEISEESENDGQLYEHFRMEVDKGQVPVRIDRYIVEHQPHSVVTESRKLRKLALYR